MKIVIKSVFAPCALLYLLVGSTATGAIFYEGFDTQPLNSNWVTGGAVCGTAFGQIQDINDLSMPSDEEARLVNVHFDDNDPSPNNGALLIGDGRSNGSDYIYAEYINSFPRGNNLVCQFASWGDTALPSSVGGVTLPWASGGPTSPYGPWHCDPDGASGPAPCGFPQSYILGGLGDGSVQTFFRFIAECTWQNGPKVHGDFQTAHDAAINRDSAIWIRVWLGDIDGAYGEWSDDVGATWNPIRDRSGAVIDLRGSGANNTDPAWLGLGGPRGFGEHRWYDHVEVGDDTSPLTDPAVLAVIPVELSEFTLE